jgi:iron(III) transport system ATP-binding protein
VLVRGLSMVYRDRSGTEVRALDEVDLEIDDGEFCVLLGPSGCGKTSLLRCVAGLETPARGTIEIGGQAAVIDGRVILQPQERPVGMVFQSYALWPHMTVAQNVGYPLTTGRRSSRPKKAQVRERVAAVLDMVEIGPLAERQISQLSGGQQQRVALARALAAGSNVVLFDEPLSNIDAKVRERLRGELKAMQERLGFTAVYVTHDQVEALDLADRVVVLDTGRIVQVGTPREIYYRPADTYVANFVGTSNLLSGRVLETRGMASAPRVLVRTELGEFEVPGEAAPESAIGVVTRSGDWWMRPAGESAGVLGQLLTVRMLGNYCEYVVAVGATKLRIWADDHDWAVEGVVVRVGFDPNKAWAVLDGD